MASGSGCRRCELDLVAEGEQFAGEVVGAFAWVAGSGAPVVGSQGLVGDTSNHDPVGDLQDVPAGGDGGLLRASSSGQQTVAFTEIGGLAAGGGQGGLTQSSAQPDVALAGAGAAALAGRLVVARAHGGPGGQVGGTGESGHVGAGLGDQDLGEAAGDAGDGVQQGDQVVKR